MGQKRRGNRKYRNYSGRKRYHGQRLFSIVMLCCLSLFIYGFYVTEYGRDRVDPEKDILAEDSREEDSEEADSKEDGSYGEESVNDSPAENTSMEVHFLDVGQGDATLIRCDGETLLIDAGEEDQGTAIQSYLMHQGIETLDYLLLTHPDSDHIGSADVIITKFDIRKVIMSYYEKENSAYRNLTDALRYKRLKANIAQVGDSFALGSAICTILGPVKEYEDPNNASVVLLVEHGDNRFLFTGDAEEEAESDVLVDALPMVEADVYKVGHHGSDTSSTEAFLDAVQPDWAVVSCGTGNSYVHPHTEVMERLEDIGAVVYRTDEQGTIVAVSDGLQIGWKVGQTAQ